jgi:hypothetical protein
MPRLLARMLNWQTLNADDEDEDDGDDAAGGEDASPGAAPSSTSRRTLRMADRPIHGNTDRHHNRMTMDKGNRNKNDEEDKENRKFTGLKFSGMIRRIKTSRNKKKESDIHRCDHINDF